MWIALVALTLLQPAPLNVTLQSILGFTYAPIIESQGLRIEGRAGVGTSVSPWAQVPVLRCVVVAGANCTAPDGEVVYQLPALDPRFPLDTAITLEIRICNASCSAPLSQPIIISTVTPAPPQAPQTFVIIKGESEIAAGTITPMAIRADQIWSCSYQPSNPPRGFYCGWQKDE